MQENIKSQISPEGEANREKLRKRIDMLSDTYVIRLLTYLEGLHAGQEIERKKGA